MPNAFDAARLAGQKYLTGPEAAFYLGYTHDKYINPIKAFHSMVYRNGIPHGYLGKRLMFKRVDLDAFILPGAKAAS